MVPIQHPEEAIKQDLQHIRRIVGWARSGVMAANVLITQAREKLERRIEAGVFGNEGQKLRDVLMHLQQQRLPSEKRCADAVAEVDRVLMPLRNVMRVREGYTPLPADRVLGEQAPARSPESERM